MSSRMARMEPITAPVNNFAVRIDGTGTAQAGLIALDGSGAQVSRRPAPEAGSPGDPAGSRRNPDRFHPVGHTHLGEYSLCHNVKC